MEEKQICCFTGHRNITGAHLPQLKKQLFIETLIQIKNGATHFRCGGALGFDSLAAQTVLTLKEQFPHIKLSLVLPCPEQDKFWTSMQKAEYRSILSRADEVTYTAKAYYRGCMLARNRHLIDHASCVIAYLMRETGGTMYTVRYALQHKVPVICLNPA